MTSQSPLDPGLDAGSNLAHVRIVLVAPAGPLNVGSVARVMKNFGLSQLVLVNPQCDPLGSEALQMAVHAKDVLQNALRVASIPAALVGCDRAIATTARPRGFDAPLDLPEVALPYLLTETAPANSSDDRVPNPLPDTALLFGPEDRGLSNEELAYAQRFTKIPTDPGYSALNLAQAVAICCYELYRASQYPFNTLRTSPLSGKQTQSDVTNQPEPNKAKLEDLEGYYQHLESVLLKVEYLYAHTAASRMRKFRQLLHRASPTASEVALLRGILRQVEWAVSNSTSDSTPDSTPDSKKD
ncbi:MAG: RNA methyltransferase [Phormidesmis sp.]